jgi:hypothetical protein
VLLGRTYPGNSPPCELEGEAADSSKSTDPVGRHPAIDTRPRRVLCVAAWMYRRLKYDSRGCIESLHADTLAAVGGARVSRLVRLGPLA